MRAKWVKRGSVAVFAVAAVAGAGWFALPADAATGGTATVLTGNKVQYSAGQRVANTVVVTSSGRTVTIDDRVAIKAGKGCVAVRGDATKVRCTTAATPWQVLVFTHDGNDVIRNNSVHRMTANGGAGNDHIHGGPGQDTLYGDTLAGPFGNDALWGNGSRDILIGSGGDDGLNGGDGADKLNFALLEMDHPNAGAGNDRLYGGGDGDMMLGGSGNDQLYAGPGNDALEGGTGKDLLDAGDGNDDLLGGGGLLDTRAPDREADVIRGGAGDKDTVRYHFHTGGVTVDADGQAGDDGLPGEGDSVGADVEWIYGSRFDDKLTGNASANTISGDKGNDIVRGGAGNDAVSGGVGVDEIYGDAGDDKVSGRDDDGSVDPPTAADRVDGGANTAAGDTCSIDDLDEPVGCEQTE